MPGVCCRGGPEKPGRAVVPFPRGKAKPLSSVLYPLGSLLGEGTGCPPWRFLPATPFSAYCWVLLSPAALAFEAGSLLVQSPAGPVCGWAFLPPLPPALASSSRPPLFLVLKRTE
jgi:hypothetical protein